MKKTLTRLALALAFSAASLGAFAQGVLRVSAIPDEAPTELQRKFTPLGDYLKKETGMDVQFTPVTDYAAVVEGLATHKIDLAWLGGFTFVQARIRTNGGAVPIVQRAEDEVFTSSSSCRWTAARRRSRTSRARPLRSARPPPPRAA